MTWAQSAILFQVSVIVYLTSEGLSILKSTGTRSRQPLHCDYSEKKLFREYTDEKKYTCIPLVVMVPLSGDTPFLTVPGSINRKTTHNGRIELHSPRDMVEIIIRRGDILIFRADLVHAGAGFSLEDEESNYRIHMIISAESGSIGNPPNVFRLAELDLGQRLPLKAKTIAKENLHAPGVLNDRRKINKSVRPVSNRNVVKHKVGNQRKNKMTNKQKQ